MNVGKALVTRCGSNNGGYSNQNALYTSVE